MIVEPTVLFPVRKSGHVHLVKYLRGAQGEIIVPDRRRVEAARNKGSSDFVHDLPLQFQNGNVNPPVAAFLDDLVLCREIIVPGERVVLFVLGKNPRAVI